MKRERKNFKKKLNNLRKLIMIRATNSKNLKMDLIINLFSVLLLKNFEYGKIKKLNSLKLLNARKMQSPNSGNELRFLKKKRNDLR